MSKKKSPNKATSPSVDEGNDDVVKVDVVKDEAIALSYVDDPSVAETAGSQSSALPEREGQKTVPPGKKATANSDNGKQADTPKVKRGFPVLGLLNLLLVIGLIAAAFYYWQMQQKSDDSKQALLVELQAQIGQKAGLAQVQAALSPLKSDIGSSVSRIDALQQQQQALQASAEKLFDLYGRSESDWQLAEVIYLLRIAQHKLVLENDFEGAALTLQAASDKIATTADPGLLPVRVLISEEIADLKTRARPDLVGMTLLLSQLSQQIQTLKHGYQATITDTSTPTTVTELAPADATIEEKVTSFFTSLVTVKRNAAKPTATNTTTKAFIVNIEETMESNLKLTRWTVLERDDYQYRQLMLENIRLFEQYYDLDDAANNDFYAQLLQLQKSVIKPTKPTISGSLQLLNNIISQRQNAPDAVAPESVNEAADDA
jgi:uroporphyrin-3 C-methyltransferase